jgi:hypothetical protein
MRAITMPQGGPGAALADIASTPLGLWLLRVVYITPRTDPAPLLDTRLYPDTAALRNHLLDRLIPALIDTRPPSDDAADMFRPRRHHDPYQVQRWLGYLAHHLTTMRAGDGTVGTRDFIWWRLAETTNTLTRKARLTIALTLALTVALTSTMGADLAVGPTEALTNGLGYGLGEGLIAGAVVGFAARSWSKEPPGFADLHMGRRSTELARKLTRAVARGLAAGLMIALVLGTAVALTVGPATGLAAGIAAVLVTTLAMVFTTGFTAWAEAPTPLGRANTPLASWRADRTLNLVRSAAVGLTVGSISFFAGTLPAVGTRAPAALVPVIGSTLGTAFGLAAGLAAGSHHAWMAYLVATRQLARAQLLPRKLMSFLDDAHRLGLLRAVGPIYQFRHAELHDHLAARFRRIQMQGMPGDPPDPTAAVNHVAASALPTGEQV